ncbi:hypothetical protein Pla175_35140 [Pirellulimonas nuda]|uniref:Uncharacterized protein n=1 Tax=Pirellulimonas nuda TaxID=2528009 RepID=A0A518DF49_9BACT|nr:hypothetical protein [Pirellulimonas nuda]QDU90114.1 hypothetical protein Pla175_35140 [Pirellulimonas nuda]
MSAQRPMYYVGFCRVCTTGPLGVRACGHCGRLSILCDECDAAWSDANLAGPPKFASEADLPCPECGKSLVGEPSHWADVSEIHDTPWLREALEAGTIELRHGAAWRLNE